MGLLPIPAPRLTQGASRAGIWRAAALYDKRLLPPSFKLPHVSPSMLHEPIRAVRKQSICLHAVQNGALWFLVLVHFSDLVKLASNKIL